MKISRNFPYLTLIVNVFWIGYLIFDKIDPITIILSFYVEMLFVIFFGIRKIKLAKHIGIEATIDKKKGKGYVIKKADRNELIRRAYLILFAFMPFLLIFTFITMAHSGQVFAGVKTEGSFSAFIISSLSNLSQFWLLLLTMSGSLFLNNYLLYRRDYIIQEGYKKAYASSRLNEILTKFSFLFFMIFISLLVFPKILIFLMILKTALDIYFIFNERKSQDDKNIQRLLRKTYSN